MNRFLKDAWTVVIPQLLILVTAPPLYFLVDKNSALLYSMGGTVLVLFGNLLYIVFWHSRRRWPQLGAVERFTRVMTYQR